MCFGSGTPRRLRRPSQLRSVLLQAVGPLLGQLAIEAYKLGQTLPLGVGVFAHIGGLLGGMLFIYLFIRPEVVAGQR